MDVSKSLIHRTTARHIEDTEFASGRKSTFVVTRATLDMSEEDDWILVAYGYRKEGNDLLFGRLDRRQVHFTSERGLPEELHPLFLTMRNYVRE